MPGKRAFEEQLAALEALRHRPAEARVAPLRKALATRTISSWPRLPTWSANST